MSRETYFIPYYRLVFAVLYKLAWTESCRHDMAAKWHEKYIEHMEVSLPVVTTVPLKHRRRINAEENANVVAAVWGTLLNASLTI